MDEFTPRIETYYVCTCGWKREYTDTLAWRSRRIPHPIWGTVSQIAAVHLDTQAHNCLEYNAAMNRSPRAREVPVDYEAAQKRAESDAAYKSLGRTR